MKRREALGLLLTLPVITGCGSSYRSVAAREEHNVIILPLTEFSDGESILVRSKLYRYPIYVFRDGAVSFRAILAECTHKGCELQLEGSAFVCPCHGSEFDLDGNVANGPASKELYQFRVAPVGSDLYIYLS